jgi:hypothetical protein
MNTLRLHRGRSRANKVAHRFMPLIRNPDRRQLSGPQKLGQSYRIASIGLYPIARPSRYQRGRNDIAGIAHASDETE